MKKTLSRLKAYVPLGLRMRCRLGPPDWTERTRQWVAGRPLPPPVLIQLISNSVGARYFTRSGGANAEPIKGMIRRHSLRPARVLDFGCGAGRILRHLSGSAEFGGAEFHGCDYNPDLIDWCRKNLKPARFAVNAPAPPLPYPDGHFDFVYSYSVFTHLCEELQTGWVRELGRVLPPGGHLYLTVHGERFAAGRPAEEREAFGAGRLVVVGENRSGSNACAAFHPEAYVRGRMTMGFEVVDFAPEGAGRYGVGLRQDAYLLRKI